MEGLQARLLDLLVCLVVAEGLWGEVEPLGRDVGLGVFVGEDDEVGLLLVVVDRDGEVFLFPLGLEGFGADGVKVGFPSPGFEGSEVVPCELPEGCEFVDGFGVVVDVMLEDVLLDQHPLYLLHGLHAFGRVGQLRLDVLAVAV